MLVMIIKGLLIVIPLSNEKGKYCLTYRRRGSYFSLIEHVSQFYISLLTIRPWMEFLLGNIHENLIFSSLLILFYSLVKLFNLYKSICLFRRSILEAFQSLPFPSVSTNDLRDNLCPICQSEYQDPIVLTCKVSSSLGFPFEHFHCFSIFFVKNVFHHGLIEMHHVHSVDVNYLLDKRIIVMDSLRDISFGIKTKHDFFFSFQLFMENFFSIPYHSILYFCLQEKLQEIIFQLIQIFEDSTGNTKEENTDINQIEE